MCRGFGGKRSSVTKKFNVNLKYEREIVFFFFTEPNNISDDISNTLIPQKHRYRFKIWSLHNK